MVRTLENYAVVAASRYTKQTGPNFRIADGRNEWHVKIDGEVISVMSFEETGVVGAHKSLCFGTLNVYWLQCKGKKTGATKICCSESSINT